MLTPEELDKLSGAETLFPSPIPVQSVSSDEFVPAPQTPKQREFEVRVKALGTSLARKHGKVAYYKDLYARHGDGRSNLAYGYVDRG